ncbi:MAG: hypothetical protein IKP65_06900 [Alphaproteobacteria bacterium]|nr:hypothetical protein [Alphaproteobacteria bacterium]
MSNYVLYTTHCPKCRILEKKLQDKKIEFTSVEDVNEIMKTGYKSVPLLQSPDGKIMDYYEAVKLVNSI